MIRIIDKIEKKILSSSLVVNLIFFLALIAVFPPYCFFWLFPDKIRILLRVAVLFCIYLSYLIYIIKYKQIDFFIIIMSLFSFFQVFSTFINGGYLKAAIYQNTIITIAGLIVLDLLFKFKIEFALNVLLRYFVAVIIFSLFFTIPLSHFFYIDGWLIGRRTSFILIFIPAFFFKVLYDYQHKKKFLNRTTILLCILIILHTIIDFSSTLFVLEIFSFSFAYYIYNYNKIKINIYVYIAIYLFVFFVFVLPGTNNHFSQYFALILGKSPTASGRLPIYDDYMTLFKNRPLIQNIIGGGFLDPEGYKSISHIAVFAHNIILQIFCDFGIIGIIFLIFQIVYTAISTNYLKQFTKQIIQLFFFVMLFRSSYDSYQYYDWVFILGIIINLSSKLVFDLNKFKFERRVVKY